MNEEQDNTEERPPTLAALAEKLQHWKATKAAAEEMKKVTEKEIIAVEKLIYDRMQLEEIDRYTHGGYNFKPKVESYPSVNKENEDQLHDWLEERHIRLAIHAQSLKGWYNAHAEEYAEELSDKKLINVFEKIKIGVTKA